MIYDCFIFNDELDLLKLRLNFLNDIVDYFVIVESNFTFTNKPKSLCFYENRESFKEYSNKIIHLVVNSNTSDSAWDNEFYQREYIKQGIKECNDDDIIIISDVDEIPNLYDIIPSYNSNSVHRIKMTLSYYFLNTLTKKKWELAIIGKYKSIKNIYLGNRNDFIKETTPLPLKKNYGAKQGWHLSYLFGFNYNLYSNKIKSFSHTEFDNDKILNAERIYNIILNGKDLFDRPEFQYWPKKPERIFTTKILTSIKTTNMDHYLFPKPEFKRTHLIKYLRLIYNYYN